MNLFIIGYFILWALGLLAAFVFFFVVLNQRFRERKNEKQKHKDYNKY